MKASVIARPDAMTVSARAIFSARGSGSFLMGARFQGTDVYLHFTSNIRARYLFFASKSGKCDAEVVDSQWRSECPIASSLDIVGDKWTLLVLRDLLDGKTRFSELERSPEKVPTNILTDRLRRLETHHLIERRPGEGRRVDYFVTAKGEAMRPVLLAMADWGNEFIPDTWQPPPGYLSESVPRPE